MGRYERISKFKEEEFKRLTGLKKVTFERAIEILKEVEKTKKARGGRPNKLTMEDRLLMACQYWREYRDMFHIGFDFGIAKSNVSETIRWIEDILIKSGEFTLPGRKALIGDDIEYEIILVDATETPIERPKKNRNHITKGKRSDTL